MELGEGRVWGRVASVLLNLSLLKRYYYSELVLILGPSYIFTLHVLKSTHFIILQYYTSVTPAAKPGFVTQSCMVVS